MGTYSPGAGSAGLGLVDLSDTERDTDTETAIRSADADADAGTGADAGTSTARDARAIPSAADAVPSAPAAVTPAPASEPDVATRVTPPGLGLLGAAVVLVAGAAVLHYAELVALAAAAICALLVATLSVARRPRLRATLRVNPNGVARGEPAALVIEIHNPSRRPSPPVRLHIPWSHGPRAVAASSGRRGALGRAGTADHNAGARTGAGMDSGDGLAGRLEGRVGGGTAAHPTGKIVVDVRRVPGAGTRSLDIALDTRRRGVISFGPVLVRRADPFGLVSSTVRLSATDVLRVRPRARPLGAPPAAPARDPDGRTADGAAGGVIFHGIREYVSGEDLRFVHWPSSARTGVLMVREHVEPSEPASTVVLDTRPEAYPPGEVGADTFEEAVDVAASVVLGCARESLGVVLLTTDGVRRAGRGRAPETEALLDELAEIALGPTGTLEVLSTVRRGGVGTLIVVTGGFDGGQLRAVAPVVHRFGQVVVVRVGARSMAAARARSRHTPAERPRLRRAADPDAAALLGRFDLIGRPSDVGTSVAGRLRVLDIPDASRLPEAWPVGGRGRGAGVRSNTRAGYFGGGM
ncbi:DUF58 domain-containing protein [Pseudofrankia sp. BMG5.37]|uniref:DUF58 domain-containing protein n=1 Tax=Pseudofrankia sp. BMG5.37 TaxID=3050035 RepID=UPI002894A7B8|nr:DUF58 domain-containing protein [Pseudofrankia sp. BMG5.37]MDT3443683.1 DUF58 domain-containing protein [Pseudofrankia sp. BMG5.37]